MASVCFYFQVHQPWRLRRCSVFDRHDDVFDVEKNAAICRKVAEKCYLPANRLMLEIIRRYEGRVKLTYSLSGVVIDQFESTCPEVLESFRRLAETGCVEFLAETYYHSLSFLYSRDEFAEQVSLHQNRICNLFGQIPNVFRNTELIYNNDLAHLACELGFSGILCEGVDDPRSQFTPARLYHAPGLPAMAVMAKNYRMSDDIAFRFSSRTWSEWPLTAEKYARWVDQVNGNGHLVNLFMDYETLGEHQWAETGIFDFLEHLPREILKNPENDFLTVSEAIQRYPRAGEYDVPHVTSWADTERDLSAWLGNAMQSNALHELYRIEKEVKAVDDPELLHDWRRLQSSDHFYYMCVKYFADAVVHQYFNPYDSPYDSYINFMNVLDLLKARIGAKAGVSRPKSLPTDRLATQGRHDGIPSHP